VSLLALSATDHPELETIVDKLSDSLHAQRVSTSLPSLRPGSVPPSLLKKASRVRKFGLTIAPEAGTERLRLFIRKDFPDQAIFDTARVAFSNGWTGIKLYFMVGLPSETEDDLLGIAEICRQVLNIGREYTRKAGVTVTLSPFVPKAHTPFQWDEAIPEADVFNKIKFVKRQIRSGPIQVRHNSSQTAMIAALLGRGGRELAPVIETAYRKGCRFDSWGEMFDFDKWIESFAECGIDPLEGVKAIPFSQSLPWSHIAKGVSAERLQQQREASSQELRPYVSLLGEQNEEPQQPKAATGFGRNRKVAATRSQIAPTKSRVRVQWSKSIRYRYMSHLENLHMLERALRRARLPVMYSQGHNPGMKLSLGPPLPLGFTSEAEYIDITLESNLQSHMIDDFRAQLPDGIDMIDARVALGKKASLNAMLNRAEYTLPVSIWPDQNKLEDEIAELLATEHLECGRGSIEKRKTVDIRPAIYELTIADDQLTLLLGLGEGGYAKPTEVVGFLKDQLTVPCESLAFHRRAMYRIDDFRNRIEAMDL
jgi:radical SAM-linked protein